MFRTDLIAAAAATMIAATAPIAVATPAAAVAHAEAGIQQQLTAEFWNGSRWNGVFADETVLSDDAIDAPLAALEPQKVAA